MCLCETHSLTDRQRVKTQASKTLKTEREKEREKDSVRESETADSVRASESSEADAGRVFTRLKQLPVP